MYELKEYEIICSECNGTGNICNECRDNCTLDDISRLCTRYGCIKCKGTGKLDWLQNIYGKKPGDIDEETENIINKVFDKLKEII